MAPLADEAALEALAASAWERMQAAPGCVPADLDQEISEAFDLILDPEEAPTIRTIRVATDLSWRME